MAVTPGCFFMFSPYFDDSWVPASKDGKRAIRSIGSLWQKDLACPLGSSVLGKYVALVKVDWHNSRIILIYWCWFHFLLATSPELHYLLCACECVVCGSVSVHLCVPFGKKLDRSSCSQYIYILIMYDHSLIVIHVQYTPSSYCCHVACNHPHLPKTKTLLQSHGGEEGPTSQGVPGHAEDLNFTSSTTSGDATYRCL